MIEPLQREFLRDVAARRLREAIAEGVWQEHLPSEAVLCKELHVSRRTIRTALAQLVREKLLQKRGRGRTLAITTPTCPVSPKSGATVIRYLSPRRMEMNDRTTQVVENTLREFVGQEGFSVEFECRPDIYQRFSAKRMAALTARPDTAAWVLLHATREMQEWFAASGQPCVVTGSCHQGVDLPSVEFDFFASCFHAVHLLATHSGKHVVFVAPATLNASEQSAVRGFLAGAVRFPGLKTTVTRHDGTRDGICRALQPLLKEPPKPTGYLVMLPEFVFTTLGFLHAQGVRVPEDASLICRSDDFFLDFSIPSVAQYRLDCVKFGNATGALTVEIIRHGMGRSRHVKIVPEFVPGRTFRKEVP